MPVNRNKIKFSFTSACFPFLKSPFSSDPELTNTFLAKQKPDGHSCFL